MARTSLQVAVVGPGAVGGTVAARLAVRTSHALTLCARRPFEGLRLAAPDGRFEAPLRPLVDPREAAPVDWVLFAVKAHHTAGAAAWLRGLVRPGTRLAILQNGVEHLVRLAPFSGPAELLPVVVSCPAEATDPGRILQRAGARLVVPGSPAGEAFRALLEGTGIEVALTGDFTTASWKKLCSNAAGGALTALTSSPIGVMRRPDLAALARVLVEECMAVGRAAGARFPAGFADELIAGWQGAAPEEGTSMLADRRKGRALEYDARNAVVVRLGERHGVPTPVSRAITALLAAIGDKDAAEHSPG